VFAHSGAAPDIPEYKFWCEKKQDKFGAKTLPNLVRKRDLFFKKTWCDKRDKLIKMD